MSVSAMDANAWRRLLMLHHGFLTKQLCQKPGDVRSGIELPNRFQGDARRTSRLDYESGETRLKANNSLTIEHNKSIYTANPSFFFT
jgi:hypothetical protein